MKPLELLLNWLQIQARWKWNHGAAHQTELFQASSRSRQSHDRCHCEPNTGHVHAVANLQSGTQSDEVYSGVAESHAAEGHRSTKHCQTARPSEGRRPPEPWPEVVSQAFRAGPQAPADLPQKHAQKKTGYACTVTTPVLHAAECRHAAIDMASRDVHQARACTGQCISACPHLRLASGFCVKSATTASGKRARYISSLCAFTGGNRETCASSPLHMIISCNVTVGLCSNRSTNRR